MGLSLHTVMTAPLRTLLAVGFGRRLDRPGRRTRVARRGDRHQRQHTVDAADEATGVHRRRRSTAATSPAVCSPPTPVRPPQDGALRPLRASVTAGCGTASRTTAHRRWRAGRRPTSPRTRPRSARCSPGVLDTHIGVWPLFEGFIAEIVANGYKVDPFVSGYSFRCTGGSNPNGWKCAGDVERPVEPCLGPGRRHEQQHQPR